MFKRYRLLATCLALTAPLVAGKFLLHSLDWEVIGLGSLHTSVITGTFFVLGFILSAIIADYKESERIPAEIAAIIQNMADDADSIHTAYPTFNIKSFRKRMLTLATSLSDDIRHKKFQTQEDIHGLSKSFIDMEKAGVPANFIVKLKQQQAQLLRILLRVAYIQRIRFVPSATILARTIVCLVVGLLLFTEIEPFYAGLALTAIISFILLYVLRLIEVVSTPFHSEGQTQDDVSLFLIEQTVTRLQTKP